MQKSSRTTRNTPQKRTIHTTAHKKAPISQKKRATPIRSKPITQSKTNHITLSQSPIFNAQPSRSYSQKVIEYNENPKNVGSFDAKSSDVGTGLVGAPACGDVMKLQVKVENGIVKDVKFRTFGCGSAIASSSYATEWLKGKTVEEAMTIKNTDIASHLSLPPVKLHCSMLAEDAVKAAIQDYQKKQDAAKAAI